MVKHPKELGFSLGLVIRIGEPASMTKDTPEAKTVRGVVYVALLAESSGSLEKGDALKIGQTAGTLKSRWRGIVGLFSDASFGTTKRLTARNSWK